MASIDNARSDNCFENKTRISRPALLAGVSALGLLALSSVQGHAACTTDGTTVTCTGSDFAPVGYTSSDGSIGEIIVEDLTDDISVSGGTAISLSETAANGSSDGGSGSSASDGKIKYDGSNTNEIYGVSGATETSFTVMSTGGDGAEGQSRTNTTTHAGSGGAGGAAGTAEIVFEAGYLTQSAGTAAFQASSAGGDGANGGEHHLNSGDVEYISLYGGAGGDGGTADDAEVALIDVDEPGTGDGLVLSGLTVGISATSIGGDGGSGGEAYCDDDGVQEICTIYSGKGGAGAAAGTADVTLNGALVSITDTGIGTEVLSTGGAGGDGGLAKVGGPYNTTVGNDTSNDYGNGGQGGDASTATLILKSGSSLEFSDTDGSASYGVLVSSAGGAGGNGNDSDISGSEEDDTNGLTPGYGNGGQGGSGGMAELTMTDSFLKADTNADDAISVLVSSTGGDGGNVGDTNRTGQWVNTATGANGGAGGDGGDVTVTMDSDSELSVGTSGSGNSTGALTLLSRGGDGGDGSDGGQDGYNGSGNGGAGGAGGTVTGTLTTASAATSGDDAYGIWLISAGGTGGSGATLDGSGGDGGSVGLTIDTATIKTTGEGAHGISASSQGGGSSGSVGDVLGGSSGKVNVTVSAGTIEVSGLGAYGISAASLSGTGSTVDGDTADDVTVTSGADITASGQGGVGIYAESTGTTTSGTVSVTIETGGSVKASDDAEAAIAIYSGDDNTLINNGTITTDDLSSSSIYALTGSGSALTVTNNGTFEGSVDLDDSYANSFTNASGATANLGASFDLGSDGSFSNEAMVSPGGEDNVLTSAITGAFTQTADGTYLVDLDNNETDELNFLTDGATLDGTVEVNIITSPTSSGNSVIALSSDGTLDASGLTVSDTATVDFSLSNTNNFVATLDWEIDMADSDTLGSANGNQTAVAQHLQQVLEHEEGALGTELASLLNIADADDYVDALDSFASQIAADVQLSQLFSAQQFSDALLSCSVRDGVYRFVDQDQCAWLRAGGSGLERSATGTSRGFDQTAWQFAGGGQFEVRDNWFIGTGFSIETQSLSVDDIASADGNIYQGGIVAKHTMGNTMLSASLSGGYGDFDVTRYLFSTDIAKGNETLWTVSGQISASHAFVAGDWYLKPRVDLGFDHVAMNGFTESGAGGASLTVHGNGQTWYSIQPAVEFGGEIKAGNGVLIRPNLTVGLTQFLGDAAPSTSASFADTPAGVAPFTVTSDFDKTYFDVKAGFEVLATDSISVTAQGFGQFSENITSYGGSAKLGIRF